VPRASIFTNIVRPITDTGFALAPRGVAFARIAPSVLGCGPDRRQRKLWPRITGLASWTHSITGTKGDEMTTKESLKYQLRAAQCGFAFEILFTIFWGLFGHNLPPASPNLSAHDLAAFFAQHHNAILLGNSVAAVVGVLWIPWTAQLSIVMWRIEGSSPVLSIIQLIGGALTAWVLMFCPAIWATAAFRPDIDPNTVRMLNDLGFILFNITYAVTSVQAIAAGLAGLGDKSARPVFPRWVSYWAIFTGFSFITISLMPFFKTGPFAWNGAINFWALFGTYFTWTISMGICMAKDAGRRLREENDLETPRSSKVSPASASA
jgi:hypothetical protein